jgi:hypothetical protein
VCDAPNENYAISLATMLFKRGYGRFSIVALPAMTAIDRQRRLTDTHR